VPDFSFVSCAWIRYQNSGLSRYYTGCGS
jgi:hypothetical protein